jgi:hypothetical protein
VCGSPATFQSGKLATLHKLLAQMGLTPSGRAGLAVPVKPEYNPFDQF